MNTHFDPLATLLGEKKKTKPILLISHTVLGFPSFDMNREAIDIMIRTGVDIIELQIPFSDPLADGPFFTHANETSVQSGTKVNECFVFAREMTKKYPEQIFVFMTYGNIVYQCGIEQFVYDSAIIGIRGLIIPDLTIATPEGRELSKYCEIKNIAHICMVTPETDFDRMREISHTAKGFAYVQARVGVTGMQTVFDDTTDAYIKKCKASFNIPIAVGFGITRREDIAYLEGRADIAICCTAAVKIHLEHGAKALETFLLGLR